MSIVWIGLTILAYVAGLGVARFARGSALCNPTAIAIGLIGSLLLLTKTPYATYVGATQPLIFFLAPATVALGIPLARHLGTMQRELAAIGVASVLGAVAAMLSGVAIVRCFGGDRASALSMLPRAATSPVAAALATEIGGNASLAASLSIVGGIVAAVALATVMTRRQLDDWRAIGLSAGIGGSGIAAAQVAPRHEIAAAYAAVGIALCSIVTASLAPLVASHIH